MYAYIEGSITEIGVDYIVLDNNGIGYEIQMSLNDITRLSNSKDIIRIYTYYQSNENATNLYGFIEKEEKELFLKLITVNSVGPKSAMAIIGTLGVNHLQSAILSDDEKTIAKAPGIGAKTAKRIILDLKDKISINDAVNIIDNSINVSNDSVVVNDAIMALNALGYSYTQSQNAVRAVKNADDLTVEEVLKQALKNL